MLGMSWFAQLFGKLVGAANPAGWFGKLYTPSGTEDPEGPCRLLVVLNLWEDSPAPLWMAYAALRDTTAYVALGGHGALAPESHQTVPHAIEVTRGLVEEGLVTVDQGTWLGPGLHWQRLRPVTEDELEHVFNDVALWRWTSEEQECSDDTQTPPQGYLLSITPKGEQAFRSGDLTIGVVSEPPRDTQPPGDFAAWIEISEPHEETTTVNWEPPDSDEPNNA